MGQDMGGRRSRHNRLLLTIVLGLALLAVPSQASADAWGNDFCATAAYGASKVCVSGYMGRKNTSNKTQWIGKVRVHTTCGACTSGGVKMLEAWGDGFYKSISYSSNSSRTINRDETWTVNLWLRSGTNVCGAWTFFSMYPRAIACFTIKV